MAVHFPGGVSFGKAEDGKHTTHEAPIRSFEPHRLILPLEGRFGQICQPIVAVGDRVQAGQTIAIPSQGNGIHLHTGVSGRVEAIRDCETEEGLRRAIVIRNDYQNTKAPPIEGGDILMALDRAGVIGMGGAGFPTARKYRTDRTISIVLINGCECEPYLACDYRLMLECPERVVAGSVILAEIVGAAAVICVEDNKPQAIARLQKEADAKGVAVVVLPTHYPQGGERQLIQAMIGKEVPAGGLPADVGVLVSNVATAVAAADAAEGKPLTHRIVTVAGESIEPCNLRVPIGTPISEILDKYLLSDVLMCGDDQEIVIGGPITGSLLRHRDSPILKTTAGILHLPVRGMDEMACIRCGACVRVCPMALMPFAIDEADRDDDTARCVELHAAQCISCGCCSYICPAKRELTWHTTAARNRMMKGATR